MNKSIKNALIIEDMCSLLIYMQNISKIIILIINYYNNFNKIQIKKY